MVFEAPQRLVRALDEERRDPTEPGAGAAGAAWLGTLPELVASAVARRALTVERVHVPGGRSSLVLLVRRPDGSPAVLKLAPPGARSADERAALAHWAGHGAVRLLDAAGEAPGGGGGAGISSTAQAAGTRGAADAPGEAGVAGDAREADGAAGGGEAGVSGEAGVGGEAAAGGAGSAAGAGGLLDPAGGVVPHPSGGVFGPEEDGAMLLERLQPDVPVRSLPEARSTLEAAEALRRLWVEPPGRYAFETVGARTERQVAAMRAEAEASGDAEVTALVEAALRARADLLVSPPEVRLLHGAFRQSKVLAGERVPWLAVGPDPLVGECAFDLARLVRDRVEDVIAAPSGPAVTRRRVKRLAELLDVERERLGAWTLFRTVESAVRALRVGRAQDAELLFEFATWL